MTPRRGYVRIGDTSTRQPEPDNRMMDADGHGFWLHTLGDLTITVHTTTCRQRRNFLRNRGRTRQTHDTGIWTGPLTCEQVTGLVRHPTTRLCGVCGPHVWLGGRLPAPDAKRMINPRLAEIRQAITEHFRSFQPKDAE